MTKKNNDIELLDNGYTAIYGKFNDGKREWVQYTLSEELANKDDCLKQRDCNKIRRDLNKLVGKILK